MSTAVLEKHWRVRALIGLLALIAGGMGHAKIPDATIPLVADQPVIVLAWLSPEGGPQDLPGAMQLAQEAGQALIIQPGCRWARVLSGVTIDLAATREQGATQVGAFSALIISSWESPARLAVYERSPAHDELVNRLRDAGITVQHEVQLYQRVAGGVMVDAEQQARYVGSETYRAPDATKPVMTMAIVEAVYSGGGSPPIPEEFQEVTATFLEGLVKDPGLVHFESHFYRDEDTIASYLIGWWQDRRALMAFYGSPVHRTVADWLLAEEAKGEGSSLANARFSVEVYQRVAPDEAAETSPE